MELIRHPNFIQNAEDLLYTIRDTTPGNIIALIGCSGSGKSVLRHFVLRQLFGSPSFWADNVTPVVDTMAILASGAYFNSRHFVTHLKSQVLFPDLSWLRSRDPESDAWIIEKMAEIQIAKQKLPEPRWLTEAREWENLAEACYLHKCEVVSVDHATSMLVNHKDKRPADHLFNLMSWSERYGVKIVLTGIETLPNLWANKAELRRRIRKVWIQPYNDDPDGLKDYARVIASLLTQHKVQNARDILRMTPELHLATGGIIGELKRILAEASKGGRPLTYESMAACYYSDKELRDLWDGVRRLKDAQKSSSRDELKIAKTLGMRRPK